MLAIDCIMKYDDERVWVLLRYMFVVCISWYIHKRRKIWMDGDGYRGKDTRPHTVVLDDFKNRAILKTTHLDNVLFLLERSACFLKCGFGRFV
jgi:hypothetical protein